MMENSFKESWNERIGKFNSDFTYDFYIYIWSFQNRESSNDEHTMVFSSGFFYMISCEKLRWTNWEIQ